jgi:predicted nucleotide-binding protein (sugar kinase/HSP70/actin superfamily)
MSTRQQDVANSTIPTGIPLVQISSRSKEEVIRRRLEQEKLRLQQELGIETKNIQHFARPVENPFTKDQRVHTTLLFGGLTWKHEHLIHGALEGLGYKCENVPTPNVKAFQLGKEYGNNGQCNPTYFTVGNLVQHLQQLEERGLSRKEIIDNYVFITAGACGPCRFGMYEAEYRLALRNSGFDGFRVLLFQQAGGLDQSEAEAGLEMNLDFFLGILNAMNMGDLINDVSYQIRPYEVNPGETDRALMEVMDSLHEVIKHKPPFEVNGQLGFLKNFPKMADTASYVGKFLDQLYGDDYTGALRGVRDRFDSIEVDRLRVKPIVKVIGEFWAQTTEGDGNFNMFRFLEREGAQVIVEPIGTWIMYMIHQAKMSAMDRHGLNEHEEERPSWWRVDRKLSDEWKLRSKIAKLTAAEAIFKREWNRLRETLDDLPHGLTDQYELQRMAHPFYNSRAAGGEGHLEVAKNIYYSNKDLCHMVLSLKPFGCMPSTQSDGAQSAVVNLYKDMIYLPVETSGEGEVNAHSRVQMALGEAKVKAKEEFKRVLAETGYTLDEIKAYVEAHPELERPMYRVPHHKGIVGTAANTVRHVADRMKSDER